MSCGANPARVYPVGDHLRDEIRNRHRTVDEFAGMLGWAPGELAAVLAGRAITELQAGDLARWFETSTAFWLNLQRQYDTHPEARVVKGRE